MNQILNTENTEWLYENNFIKTEKNIVKVITILVITLMVFIFAALAMLFYHLKQDSNKAVVPKIEEIKQEAIITEQEEDNIEPEEVIVVQQEINNNYIEDIETEPEEIVTEEPVMPEPEILTSASGDTYSYIGTLNIDAINLNMEIISKTTDELMKKSACKLWGADPNTIGNLCIIGHNWLNGKLFSNVPKLEIGDTFEITDLSGRTLEYEIYDKYTVFPDETECLEQETEGRKEVTLITCTNNSKQRYIFHAKEVILEENSR